MSVIDCTKLRKTTINVVRLFAVCVCEAVALSFGPVRRAVHRWTAVLIRPAVKLSSGVRLFHRAIVFACRAAGARCGKVWVLWYVASALLDGSAGRTGTGTKSCVVLMVRHVVKVCGVSAEGCAHVLRHAGVSVESLCKALILLTAGDSEMCVESSAKGLGPSCSMVCEGVRELCVSVVCVLA